MAERTWVSRKPSRNTLFARECKKKTPAGALAACGHQESGFAGFFFVLGRKILYEVSSLKDERLL